MTPHWKERHGELRQWLASHPRVLIGSDFDGTLSPIVGHAAQAVMPQEVRRTLERLVALPGVMLAVISGRSLVDLRERVGIKQAFYAGNHGLEMMLHDGVETLAPGAGLGEVRLREVVAQLSEMLAPIQGVWVEHKRWTASVHYRLAAEKHHKLIGEIVSTAMRHERELALLHGKCIWEIRPASRWDKGAALVWFMAQCGIPSRATAFFGDDVTDGDAFAVIGDGWVGVVGGMVWPHAGVRVRDPEDMAGLLAWMADVRVSAF